MRRIGKLGKVVKEGRIGKLRRLGNVVDITFLIGRRMRKC